jgi:hypothetical protein
MTPGKTYCAKGTFYCLVTVIQIKQIYTFTLSFAFLL